MWRALILALLFSLSPNSVFGCFCFAPGPSSRYVEHAAVVFVGKVEFTDDDGSEQFIQHTLVRFKVEESFKGLKAEVHDVWIDPGSCTSCYASYEVGKLYLVFAYDKQLVTKDTMSFTDKTAQCRKKPFPQAIDPKNPPPIYLAPECSGTREVKAATDGAVSHELNWLRAYKKKSETPTTSESSIPNS